MRRSSLVFGLLVLSTMPARASVVCRCGTDVVMLPASGARDVPRNTKIWFVGGVLGRSRLDGGGAAWIGDGTLVAGDDARATQQFDAGRLAPGRPYRFQGIEYGPVIRFITGERDDVAPPARPELRALSIAIEDGAGVAPVADVGFDAGLDPETVLLHFVFTGARSRLSLITTPTGWREIGRPPCGTVLPFRPGERVSVAVSALDLAGNESLAAIRELEVAPGPGLARCVREDHPACAHLDPLMVFGGTSIALICVLGLLGYTVMHFRRVRDARLAVAEPVSLLVVEWLARSVQRRAGVIAAVGVVGVPALVVMDLGPLAILSTIVGCVGLRGFFIARTALQLIDRAPPGQGSPCGVREPATAELLGQTVIVRTASEETRLEVSPRALAAARRHAVPTSVASRPSR